MAVNLVNKDQVELTLRFRVFDDGVGFRYEYNVPAADSLLITDELTTFRFRQDGTSWSIPASAETYELLYAQRPISEVETANTPFTFKTADGVYGSIHEAALYDFSEMTLKQAGNYTLKAELAPWPDGVKVRKGNHFTTSWRTIQIVPDAVSLINSAMILNLNEPSKIETTDWIRPMKYVGVWIHDSKTMSLIPVEPGSYYLMDKGYIDFKQLFNHSHRQQAFFVTRAKDNMKYEVLEERPVDKQTGVVSDSTIRLTGQKTSQWYPDTLRMVIYEDYATGNIYRFLSNDFTHSYLTIAELYRERWQVECFFKWVKQRLHIKSFYGTSQNAVFSQIWIAICDYLLLAIAKKVYHIDQNLYILSAAIGKVLFERKPLGELFVKPKRPQNDSDDGQLTLWENFFGQ